MQEEKGPSPVTLRNVGVKIMPSVRLNTLQRQNQERGLDPKILSQRAQRVLARYLVKRGLVNAETEELEEEIAWIVAYQIIGWLKKEYSYSELWRAAVWLFRSWEEGFDPETTRKHLLTIEGKMAHQAEIELAILRVIDEVFDLGQVTEKTFAGSVKALA